MVTKSVNEMLNPVLLIVDDDAGIRSQIKWGLEGYEIITADCRLDAIKQVEKHKPPLVTLDLGLPPDAEGTMEGFAALKAILECSPDTRVVVVSGSEESNSAEKAKTNGAYEYCPKPFKIVNLQQIIARAYVDYQDKSVDN